MPRKLCACACLELENVDFSCHKAFVSQGIRTLFRKYCVCVSNMRDISKQGNAQRPEVRIVSWNNDELSTDALPVHGFEHYKAKDYSLAHAPFSG